jgi:hypothetical protein
MIIEIGEQHKDGGRGEYIKFVELDRGKVQDLVKGGGDRGGRVRSPGGGGGSAGARGMPGAAAP